MDPWYLVTLVGQPEIWVASTSVFVIAYFLLRGRVSQGKKESFKKTLCVFVPGVLLTLMMVLALKSAFFVQRPCMVCSGVTEPGCNIYCEPDSSFPSGHSAAIFAVVTSVYLGTRKKKVIALYAIAALVASSRFLLGVHRPMDIIAGAVFGMAISFAVWLVCERLSGKNDRPGIKNGQ